MKKLLFWYGYYERYTIIKPYNNNNYVTTATYNALNKINFNGKSFIYNMRLKWAESAESRAKWMRQIREYARWHWDGSLFATLERLDRVLEKNKIVLQSNGVISQIVNYWCNTKNIFLCDLVEIMVLTTNLSLLREPQSNKLPSW